LSANDRPFESVVPVGKSMQELATDRNEAPLATENDSQYLAPN
jgi:hypothetical protein